MEQRNPAPEAARTGGSCTAMPGDCPWTPGDQAYRGVVADQAEHATVAARYRAGPGFVCLSGMPPGLREAPLGPGALRGFRGRHPDRIGAPRCLPA